MRTYEDLLELPEGNTPEKIAFVLSSIFEYKSSD